MLASLFKGIKAFPYVRSGTLVRWPSNQAFFTKLYLEEEWLRAELREPIEILLVPNVISEVIAAEERQRAALPVSTELFARTGNDSRRPCGRLDGSAPTVLRRIGLNQTSLVHLKQFLSNTLRFG